MASRREVTASTQHRTIRMVAITLLAMAGFAFASSATALSSVRSGSDPKLDADEGLLLVAIDTNIPLTAVHIRKDGNMLAAGVLANLPTGRTLRLYSAPAGKYRWSEIAMFSSFRYRFSNIPDYEFDVKPGRITYVGDLVFRPTGYFGADIHLANRGLTALDWLETEYPAVFARYTFEYVGHYPDPFPDFYRELRRAAAGKSLPASKLLEPPKPTKLSLTPELMWRADHVTSVNLSPSGQLLAEQTRVEGQDAWTLDLVDLVSGIATSLVRSDFPFTAINWSGDNALVVSMGRSGAPQLINIFTVGSDATGKRNFQRWKVPVEGRVVDVLPNDPGHILFTNIDSRGRMLVHKLDIGSEAALRSFKPTAETRLNKQIENDLWWLTDGDGELRIALASEGDARVLMKCTKAACEEVFTFKAGGGFQPMGLSWDGATLYGVTEEDRAQADLVAFDTATKAISKTLFSKAGIDVVAPILDSRRNPIGVNYYEGGRLVSEYFDQGNQGRAEMLGRAFNGKTVMVIDRNRDASQLILEVDSADQPPQLFHLDVAKRQASLIDDVMPALAKVKFAPTVRVAAKAADGTEIEGFLTLPAGEGKRPLIVLAHGGPIGISDDLHFDRDVQFLASLGYAVLRVNFRGSSGYGKAFREAGERNYGKLIEDDIDTVLQ
ncbi:MAG: prolyl oligopeptidase family serine peptidase, partial [Dokdonella sp.]